MKQSSTPWKMSDLSSFWLTPQQSLLYQLGLQLWPSPVSRLARHAALHRVSTYNTLKELCKHGYAAFSTIWNTAHYTMIHPSIIQNKLAEKMTLFQSIQPILESLISNRSNWLTANVYQWFEGICSLYNLRLQLGWHTKAFLGVDHIDPSIKKRLYETYLPQRIAKNISSQTIVSHSDANLYFADPKNVPQTEVLVIPDRLYDIQCEIILVADRHIMIASLSSDELSGIHIESKYLYDSIVAIFDLIWRLHKK